MGRIYANVVETIGRTPLIRLNRVTEGCGAAIVAKMESRNPLASVKDRIAFGMIREAERQGKIGPNTTLVEATSGNTGIGLAYIAAAKGLPLILVMPDTMNTERRRILQALGAKLILSPGNQGMMGARRIAERIVDENPDHLPMRQFQNPANPQIHMETTAQEIWEDTDGEVDIVVCGVGTGGTITGIAEALKTRKPSFKAIAVEPDESPVLSGGKPGPHNIYGIGAGFVPEVLRTELIDEVVRVGSEEARDMTRRLAREEGLFCGISSGAAVAAAIRIGTRRENDDKLIVTVLPDTGERYLSTDIFACEG
jgi:cysteine synthase A